MEIRSPIEPHVKNVRPTSRRGVRKQKHMPGVLVDARIAFAELATACTLPWIRVVSDAAALISALETASRRRGLTVVDANVALGDDAKRILQMQGNTLVRMAFDAGRRGDHGLATEADLLPRSNAMVRVVSVVALMAQDVTRADGKPGRTNALSRISLLDVLADVVRDSAGVTCELDVILSSLTETDRQRLLLIAHSLYTLTLAQRELDPDNGPFVMLSTGESLICDDLVGPTERVGAGDDETVSDAVTSSFNQIVATVRQRWLQLYAGVRKDCCIHVRATGVEVQDPLSDGNWVPLGLTATQSQGEQVSAEDGDMLQQMNVAYALYAPPWRGNAYGTLARATLRPSFARWCESVFSVAETLQIRKIKFRVEAFPIAEIGTNLCSTVGVYFIRGDIDDKTMSEIWTELGEDGADIHYDFLDVESLETIGLPTIEAASIERMRDMMGDRDEKG